MDVVVVKDDASRETIEAAITGLRAKQDRMPKHWHERRAEVAEEIDRLVDRWLLAAA